MPLAEAIPTSAESWYGVAIVALMTVGGWVTIILKGRDNGKKLTQVGGQVTKVEKQVTNGGTNLRDDISKLIEQGAENARMTAIVKDYVEKKMPSNTDLVAIHTAMSGISGDIRELRGEIAIERVARTDLEQLVRRHHPPTGE